MPWVRSRVFRRGCVLLAVVAVGAAHAASAQAEARGSSRAVAVRIVYPGGREETIAAAAAPPATLASSGALAWGDGVVTTGSVWMRARARGGRRAGATATATMRNVSLFDGAISVGAISMKAWADASPQEGDGGLEGSWLAQATVLGQPVRVGANVRVPLADWGYVVLLEKAVVRERRGLVGRRTFVSALHVHLTQDQGALPAGSELIVGYAEAAASARKASPASTPATPPTDEQSAPVAPPTGPSRDPHPLPPGSDSKPPPIVKKPPLAVKPDFTAAGYVFPVYGPSSFGDDFGAPRAAVGWHHGNDVFAPLGAPLLAVTDGTLFLVGWNDLGGNRLWLRDDRGNEFYYAHLSAFSPLAVDGSRVRAGDVIGFVGATGDAVDTPPHLHFEIHPAALLGLGYDGVVNPYAYLSAWSRLADASFDWGGTTAGEAPAPGLILLQADDISAASGLDPDALLRALEMPALFGEAPPPEGPAVLGSRAGFG